MADLVSAIPIIGQLGSMNWRVIAIWTLVIILFCGAAFTLFFMILWKKKTLGIVEIDQVSHRIVNLSGKYKKDQASQAEKVWIGKYKKHIPRNQQSDLYYKGTRDMLVLVKDINGLHHPLHIMSYDELCQFMEKVKGMNIKDEFIEVDEGEGKKRKVQNPDFHYHQVYAMPNPSEDLEWLSKECQEANQEFKKHEEWWKSPTVMVVGTAFICFMLFVMSLILRPK